MRKPEHDASVVRAIKSQSRRTVFADRKHGGDFALSIPQDQAIGIDSPNCAVQDSRAHTVAAIAAAAMVTLRRNWL